MTNTDVAAAERLIAKWKGVAASELSSSQSFLIELCELLGVERPHPTAEQDYMFERPLTAFSDRQLPCEGRRGGVANPHSRISHGRHRGRVFG